MSGLAPRRVLIDPGSHHLLNLGDVAMLEVCAERLRSLWPDAELRALTTAPDALERFCPGVVAVDARGRYDLVARPPALRRPRALARVQLALGGRRRGTAAGAFAQELLRADLFVVSGRGGLTDTFANESRAVLVELELSARIGLPAALLGQGVGPLDDPSLRAAAARVLPSALLISTREALSAPAILAAAGVPGSRMAVTGDDAVEPAFRARREPGRRQRLGVNVRSAGYSGIGRAEVEAIATIAERVARERDAELRGIVMSTHPEEDDRAALAVHVGADVAAAADPAAVIERIGGCSAVVVGSYHAAVFALAQGIPALGLAATPYYAAKFRGLRDLFGDGCQVVELDGSSERLAAVETELDRLWSAAPALREELLAAAERQVERSVAAYAQLAELAQAADGSGPTTGSGHRGPAARGR